MRAQLSKLLVASIIAISTPLYAKTVEQKNINFPVQTEGLLKGEIHYFFKMLSPRQLAVQHPELFDLDSLSLNQENNIKLLINKSVTMVKKPVGFFAERQMTDDKYLQGMLGTEQKLKKISQDVFEVSARGPESYSYKMQYFFDSDDISTLPNSKVVRAVTRAKKLDVISQGASTIAFVEKTNFSKYTEGGVSVSSYIPIKENRTLIITYNIWAVQEAFSNEKELKKGFLSEIEALKKYQEEFNP